MNKINKVQFIGSCILLVLEIFYLIMIANISIKMGRLTLSAILSIVVSQVIFVLGFRDVYRYIVRNRRR